MKNRIWLGILAVTSAATWGIGRHSGTETGSATATAPRAHHAATSTAEDRQSRELLVRQAAEKFNDRELKSMADLFSTLDPSLRGDALEAWITSLGPGEIGYQQQQKLQLLLTAWAKADFEGARHWADGLKSRSTRQLALVGLAGAIAKDDPQKAFECLISNGPFSREIDDRRIENLMKQLSREALATGGDALLTLWQRLPEATSDINTFACIDLTFGPGTDFRRATDSYLDLLNSGRRWPLVPGGIMSDWAKQDPQAATDYMAEAITHRKVAGALGDLKSAIAEKDGKAAGAQWLLGLFKSIPPEQLPDALGNSGYISRPDYLLKVFPADLSAADRSYIVAGMLQNAINQQVAINDKSLIGIPDAERLDILSQLRGVTQPDAILEQAKKAGASNAQLAELKDRITRPR